MDHWSITPRPKKFGETKGMKLEVSCPDLMSPADAVVFAMALMQQAEPFIRITNYTHPTER